MQAPDRLVAPAVLLLAPPTLTIACTQHAHARVASVRRPTFQSRGTTHHRYLLVHVNQFHVLMVPREPHLVLVSWDTETMACRLLELSTLEVVTKLTVQLWECTQTVLVPLGMLETQHGFPTHGTLHRAKQFLVRLEQLGRMEFVRALRVQPDHVHGAFVLTGLALAAVFHALFTQHARQQQICARVTQADL